MPADRDLALRRSAPRLDGRSALHLALLVGAFTAALAGCAGDDPTAEAPPPPEGRTESRPTDDGAAEALLKSGQIDCRTRADTGYVNGRASAIRVVSVDRKPVEIATANTYAVMREAAARDGVHLRVISGFRTQSEQQYLYNCYVSCSCNQCNLAAPPGYSNHQSGIALDLNTHERGVLSWLRRNARRFGFYETVPSEDWHWEYLGGGPGGGPCGGGGQGGADPAPAPKIRFEGLTAGQTYRNTLWLKSRADTPIHHVRYFAEAHPLGVSEHRADGFSLRASLNTPGERTFIARGYDASARPIAEAKVTVRISLHSEQNAPVYFAGVRDGGWYRNGVDFTVDPSSDATTVDYFCGGHWLGRSTDAAAGFPVRYVFSALGWRAILAVASRDGVELSRGTLLIRVLPGEETGVGPSVRFAGPEDGVRGPRRQTLKVVGSDSIHTVQLSADGWALGAVATSGGVAQLDYTFNQSGTRKLKAVGHDANGSAVAETTITLDVEP